MVTTVTIVYHSAAAISCPTAHARELSTPATRQGEVTEYPTFTRPVDLHTISETGCLAVGPATIRQEPPYIIASGKTQHDGSTLGKIKRGWPSVQCISCLFWGCYPGFGRRVGLVTSQDADNPSWQSPWQPRLPSRTCASGSHRGIFLSPSLHCITVLFSFI